MIYVAICRSVFCWDDGQWNQFQLTRDMFYRHAALVREKILAVIAQRGASSNDEAIKEEVY